jgi:hypothetical protein
MALILTNGAFVSAMIGALIDPEQERRRNDMILLKLLRPNLSRTEGQGRSSTMSLRSSLGCSSHSESCFEYHDSIGPSNINGLPACDVIGTPHFQDLKILPPGSGLFRED